MLARQPASFGQENVIAFVILLRVLARVSYWRFSIFQSGEGSTSFNNDNNANFSGGKSAMKLSGMSIF